jgi:hypothetical protein
LIGITDNAEIGERLHAVAATIKRLPEGRGSTLLRA